MQDNSSQDHAQADGGVRVEAPNALPAYVTEALRGLTRTQKKYVVDGCIHGDCTMATVGVLRRKALFYLHIDSPNGRCGQMKLTPLGVTVQAILKAREAKALGPSASDTSSMNDLAREEI